jgi:hypothetical protein
MVDAKNVFINCPFDNDYFPLLRSLLFTLIYMDFNPKISETADSGKVRIENIKDLMAVSMYSIHDLSRMEFVKKNEYPRFNMPFECGIDFGLKMSNEHNFGSKKFLILEKEPYRYQKAISDISGNDIKAHDNEPQNLVKGVRDWFRTTTGEKKVSYREIWLAYTTFFSDYEEILETDGLSPKDINALPFSDLIDIIKDWIIAYQSKEKI